MENYPQQKVPPLIVQKSSATDETIEGLPPSPAKLEAKDKLWERLSIEHSPFAQGTYGQAHRVQCISNQGEPGAPSAVVILKVPQHGYDYVARCRASAAEIREAFKRETDAYRALQPLQGVVIPRLLQLLPADLHGRERPHSCLLLEDVGFSLADRNTELKLKERDCESIRSLYKQLHEHGYVHNDVAFRNATARCCSGTGTGTSTGSDEPDGSLSFRLIDFGRSLRPPKSEAWRFEEETGEVEHMLEGTCTDQKATMKTAAIVVMKIGDHYANVVWECPPFRKRHRFRRSVV